MLPLYAQAQQVFNNNLPGNQGLKFDKFIHTWVDNAREDSKKEFLSSFRAISTDDLLESYLERRRELVVRKNGKIIRAKTASRFVIGLGSSHPYETGMIFHRTLGRPYIPGSSLKGMMRAWADPKGWGKMEESQVEELFGSQEGVGRVIVLDAIPVEAVQFELDIMNPHYTKYYGDPENHPPADYYAPIPIFFLTIKANTAFEFALIENKNTNNGDIEQAAMLLEEALEVLGAGSKTAVGYGYFEQIEDITDDIVQQYRQVEQERQHQEAREQLEAKYSGLHELVASMHRLVDDVGDHTPEQRKDMSMQLYFEVKQETDIQVKQDAAKLLQELWIELDLWEGSNLSSKQKEKISIIKDILNEN